jgi:CheY-like chemotaxis protein
MARGSAQGLLEILDDILDFSRIESGKLSLEAIAFDPAEVAKRSVQILRLAAEEKGLELRLELDEGLPHCLRGDPGRLQQVLINLVGNAVKFTAAGSVRVQVRAEREGKVWSLRFAVVDTGIGIEREKQPRIFEAFMQADTSTTRRFGGTGLGLAISSQLVQMMGGKLEVDSAAGKGSTFSFRLRLEEAEAGEQESRPTQRLNRSLRVLVAEDNAVNRTLLQRVLERAGLRVEAVTDGKQALAAIAERSFDVVLMDIHMPEMDGLEATRRLRALEAEHGGHLPVIALTALALKGDADKCLAAGMDGYLTKPLKQEELFAVLTQLDCKDAATLPS